MIDAGEAPDYLEELRASIVEVLSEVQGLSEKFINFKRGLLQVPLLR